MEAAMKTRFTCLTAMLLAVATFGNSRMVAALEDPAERPARAETGSSSANQAFAVLQKHCARCHGETGFAKAYLVLDRATMISTGKVVPGHAEESPLYQRITGAIQPLMPAGGSRLT